MMDTRQVANASKKINFSRNCRMLTINGIHMFGNGETGSLIGLDDEGKSFIERLQGLGYVPADITDTQKEIVDALTADGFFVNDQDTGRFSRAYLHVTSHCNLTCAGCYSFEEKRNVANDLSLEDMKLILDSLKKSGIKDLIISGGEPFLNKDLPFILEHAKQHLSFEHITCISNGTVALEKYTEVADYLDCIAFSLDGYDDTSSTIRPLSTVQDVKYNTIQLKNTYTEVHLIFTIHAKNYLFAKEFGALAKELDVGFNFSFLTDKNLSSDGLLILNEQELNAFDEMVLSNQIITKENDGLFCSLSCPAGKSLISVSSNGDVYPCHMYTNDQNFLMGNLLKENLLTMVCATISTTDVDQMSPCNRCEIKYVCGGGCRYAGYALTQDRLGADTRCCATRRLNVYRRLDDLLGLHNK